MYMSLFMLVAVLSVARGARAEPGAVLISGTAPAQQQQVVSGSVAKNMRVAGWTLSDKPYSADAAAAAVACLRKLDPWICISAILRDKQIQRVAIVSIDPKPGKDGSTDTVITERLVIANMDSLFVAQRFCAYCTNDKLAALAAEVTKELLDRAAVGSGQTVVAIKSVPRGARVYIDTNLVGVTDASINIVPGAHTITVESDNYPTDTQHVVDKENTTQEDSFTLRPSTRPGFPLRSSTGSGGIALAANGGTSELPGGVNKKTRPWIFVSKLAMGIGAAAFVTGVVLVAIDEDPVTRPDQDASRRYLDSGTGGFIIGLSGLAIAGGGYLFWRYSRPKSIPTVTPVEGGTVVGLAHSF